MKVGDEVIILTGMITTPATGKTGVLKYICSEKDYYEVDVDGEVYLMRRNDFQVKGKE